MISAKLFAGVVIVFMVITLALITAVYDQRQAIYGGGPSGGVRMSTAGGESWGYWGGAWAQSQVDDKTLFTSGYATASDNPDKVTIMFSVETQDERALVSQQQNAQKTAAVRAALVAKGIAADKIETTGYNLYQVREWDSDLSKYVYVGFKTTHSMKVELADISRAGDIIDAAVSAGANSVDNVYFGLSDAKMQSLRMQALKSAAEDARARGDAIASGLGVRITRVMSVNEGYTYTPSYTLYERSSDAAGAGAAPEPTQITPGSVQVTATVNAVFEIA